MEVKKGFKQTDAGIIPEDWNVYGIGDLIEFQGGSQPDKRSFIPTRKIGYIRLIQIRDYKTDKYETYVPQNLAKRFCGKDDIMIGRYGPPIFQILRGLEGAYNVALIKAIPKEKRLNKSYAYYYLKQEKLFLFIEKLSQRSSGQTGVDLRELKAYPLTIPPTLKEQTTIATALSDVDALIQSVNKLIAKKHVIKQGAMQALLKPKEGWIVKKIGDIADTFAGGTPLTSNPFYYGGEIPWITSGDLNKGIINYVDGRITKQGLENSSAKMIKENTLLMALYGATSGITAISKVKAAINQAVLAIIPREDNNIFLFYQLNHLKDWIINTYTQGGQPNLSGDIIKSIEISFPSLADQNNISNILSDMDSEISALETNLDKYKQIKQGMMQNLLTGRIRLV